MNTYVLRSLLLTAIFTLSAAYASAATFLAPEGEVASVRQDVSGDIYAASNAVVIAAPVHGDIFAAGDSVDISGANDDSIFAVGRSITISGTVGDDVRVAGNSISLTSNVAHDVFAGGSTIFIGPESHIGGDVFVAGSDSTIAGTITGTLRVAGERVTIAKTAVITGDLIAYQNKPTIEQGAIIKGATTTVVPPANTQYDRRSGISMFVKSAVSRALLAFLLVWLAPRFSSTVLSIARTRTAHTGLLGLAITIIFLPITLLLLVTGIGFHTALLIGTTSLFLIILGTGYATLFLGYLVGTLLSKASLPAWQQAALGGLAAAAITLTGGIGFLVLSVFCLIGLGATARTLKDTLYV